MRTIRLIIFLCLPLLTSFQAKSQNRTLYFFNKNDNQPIEYFSLFSNKGQYIATSDMNGKIQIAEEYLETGDTLIFFHVAHVRKRLSTRNLQDTTYLKSKINTLPPITVKAKDRRFKNRKVGAIRKSNGRGVLVTTCEIGNFIEHQWPNRLVKIKSFHVYIRNDYFDPEQKFRIHIYKGHYNDSVGRDMLQRNIYGRASRGNQWVDIDLESENLYLPPEGIVAAIESLGTMKSDQEFEKYIEDQYSKVAGKIPFKMDSSQRINTIKHGLSVPTTNKCHNCPDIIRSWSRVLLGHWEKAKYTYAKYIYVTLMIER